MRKQGFPIFAAMPIATLLALLSGTGILYPAIYAQETPAWLGQAIGQDGFDLVIAAPGLVVCGYLAIRSTAGRFVLAGAYAYVVYELVIYAFAVHFNALFLVYCATLGLASFALLGLIVELRDQVTSGPRWRLGGGFIVGIGVVFGLLWLAEDLPAVLRGTAPASLAETGLATNPVHVIDLSFVLPAHIVAGVALWQGRRLGAWAAPVLLAFGVPMAASIGTMMIMLFARGEPTPLLVIAMMFAMAAANAIVLTRLLFGEKRARLAQ